MSKVCALGIFSKISFEAFSKNLHMSPLWKDTSEQKNIVSKNSENN